MTTAAERFGEGFGGERMWGLKELEYPDSIALLPQTPGWYAVAVLVVVAIVWGVWLLRRRRQANAYRREALNLLADIEASRLGLNALPFVLRKSALVAFPRLDVASLRGSAWCDWLNGVAGRTVFTTDDIALVDKLAYLPAARLESLQQDAATLRLITQTRQWLRLHRA